MTIPHIVAAVLGRAVSRLGVTLVPVYLPDAVLPDIATGADAGLQVHELESPSVPTLTLTNPTKRRILVVQGEQFLGGDQNRTLNVSVLVPAGATLEVPVSCLEVGRWGRRRAFNLGPSLAPMAVRRIMHESVNAAARYGALDRSSDQSAVWEAVDDTLARHGVQSPSSAMADADEAVWRRPAEGGAISGLVKRGPAPGQCGVMVFHGDQVRAVEIFGSPALLAAYWEPVVRAHIGDRPDTAGRAPSRSARATALAQLHRLGRADAPARPAIGEGEERHLSDADLEGQALTLDGAVIHLSAFSEDVEPWRRSIHSLRTEVVY